MISYLKVLVIAVMLCASSLSAPANLPTIPSSFVGPIKQSVVTVTAYSSREIETDDSPFIAAWGDSVGVGTIAVSRDLLRYLKRGQRVLLFLRGHKHPPDTFIVNDKMGKRWNNRVDIWFDDHRKALSFGKKQGVQLVWSPMLIPSISTENL